MKDKSVPALVKAHLPWHNCLTTRRHNSSFWVEENIESHVHSFNFLTSLEGEGFIDELLKALKENNHRVTSILLEKRVLVIQTIEPIKKDKPVMPVKFRQDIW